jgi:competence protein ComGC
MGRSSLIREFWEFLRSRKRYWLLPIIIILLLLGILLVVAESSAVAPFIYTIF